MWHEHGLSQYEPCRMSWKYVILTTTSACDILTLSVLLLCRYQSLNLTHVPEHSPAIYEFRWHQPVWWILIFLKKDFFLFSLFFLRKTFKNRDCKWSVKQRSVDATEEVKENYRRFQTKDKCKCSPEKEVRMMDGTRNKWMYVAVRWKGRNEGRNLTPEPAAETGLLLRVHLPFFTQMFCFEKFARHSISRHLISWFLFCLLFFFSPPDLPHPVLRLWILSSFHPPVWQQAA